MNRGSGEIRFCRVWLYTAESSPRKTVVLVFCLKQHSPFLTQSNLPVVLLAVAGNCRVASTAIFADIIYTDEWVSIKLHSGSLASENVLQVVHTFGAINLCEERFRGLCEELRTSTSATPPAKVM